MGYKGKHSDWQWFLQTHKLLKRNRSYLYTFQGKAQIEGKTEKKVPREWGLYRQKKGEVDRNGDSAWQVRSSGLRLSLLVKDERKHTPYSTTPFPTRLEPIRPQKKSLVTRKQKWKIILKWILKISVRKSTASAGKRWSHITGFSAKDDEHKKKVIFFCSG